MSPKPEANASAGGPDQVPPGETFESAFEELQRVVELLETGGLDLDRVVHLYDRGMTLAQTCERTVADAELHVTRLTAETASPLSDA